MEKFNQKKSCPYSNAMELIGESGRYLLLEESMKIRK